MSRISSWTERIPLILQHLETDAQAVYTRPEIVALFKIGRSRAADLMKIAGAEVRNGTEATVGRSNLRYYVERCPAAKAFLVEQARKEKLARQLVQTAADVRQREIEVPGVTRQDKWARWKDLANVDLKPGRCVITFEDAEDFLRTLQKISVAVANEFDEFMVRCERPVPKQLVDRTADLPDWQINKGVFSRDQAEFEKAVATPEERARIMFQEATA